MSELRDAWHAVKYLAARYTMGAGLSVAELAKAYDRYMKLAMELDPMAGEIAIMVMTKPVPVSVKRKDIPRFLIAHPEFALEVVKPWVT